MDLRLSDEQEQLTAALAGLLAKGSSTEQVRAAEPSGFDPSLWRSLGEMGLVAMAVPEARGGWGAATLDLALAAEQLGRSLASAPVIETQVAARLLSSNPGANAAALVTRALEGPIVTLAVRPADADADAGGASGGRASLVPGAAVADACLVLQGDRLLAVELDDGMRHPVANLGSSPLADVHLPAEATVIAQGPEVVDAFEAAIDLWLALTASALVGVGSVAHEMTCAYAVERHAWGKPIGSFQGVAHPLADSRTDLDGSRLIARKAAWAIDEGHPRARELAAMAFAVASEASRDATYQAVHFHGGYGFMLETDVQLFYRRARAWARVWGDPTDAYRRAARARYDLKAR